jgi:hypothetical protein
MFAMAAPDYLNPALPDGLRGVRMPIVDATDASLQATAGSSTIPHHARSRSCAGRARMAARRRRLGDEGGTTKGVFVSEWRGDILYGRNEAVDGTTSSRTRASLRAPTTRISARHRR